MVISEEAHVVNILPAQDINGGADSDVFSMGNYSHASIIISAGTTGAASTVTVKECDDFTPSNSAAIAFDYYKEETDSGDTLSARQSADASGFEMSTNDNIMYVIEVDAAELTDGYPNLQVSFSDPAVATDVSAVAVLTGARYAQESSPTEIS